jgi:hypothetical protein
MPLKFLSLAVLVVLGLGAACSAKNEAGNQPLPPAPRDPGPISPNSWLLNPPQQQAR